MLRRYIIQRERVPEASGIVKIPEMGIKSPAARLHERNGNSGGLPISWGWRKNEEKFG